MIALFILIGCTAHRTPLWLDSGLVNMSDYKDRIVFLLPVEVSPSYRMTDGERSELRGHVLRGMKEVFGFEQIKMPETIDRLGTYPFTHEELESLAITYRADAAVAISVSVFERKHTYGSGILSVRISFSDPYYPDRAWSISREYASEAGQEIGSKALDERISSDLEAVRDALDPGRKARSTANSIFSFGIVSSPPSDGPRLRLTTPASSAGLPSERANQLGDVVNTTLSRYPLAIAVEDDSGIKMLEVYSKTKDLLSRIVHPEIKSEGPVTFKKTMIFIDLELGKNKIVVRSVNSNDGETVRELMIIREESEDVFMLVVAISEYANMQGFSSSRVDWLHSFANASDSDQSEYSQFFLYDRSATQLSIMEGVRVIAGRIAVSDGSIGLFYYTGHVLADGESVYLTAYDTKRYALDITAIPTHYLSRLLGERCYLVLDLCVKNSVLATLVRDALPEALISLNSCGFDAPHLADHLLRKVTGGLPLRDAIEQLQSEVRSEER
jgi:hypothetical protein